MSEADILIVEDNPAVAQELREQLGELGYNVVGVAASGEEAIDTIDGLHPHLVFMNMRLSGGIDGIQTGSYIRDQYDTPVIYLTDYDHQTTIRRAGATGPFGYVFRPFDKRQLFASVEIAVIRHQLESQLQQSQQWLNTTLTSIAEGVIATDEEGKVRFINPVAIDYIGGSHAEAIGKPLSQIFSLVEEESHTPIEVLDCCAAPALEPLQSAFTGLLVPRKGALVPVEAHLTSIEDGKGKVHGRVLLFRDMTRHRKAMQEIQRQANRAEALLDVASQLNSQLELKTVLHTICEITNRAIHASATTVVLPSVSKQGKQVMAEIRDDPVSRVPRFEAPREIFQKLLTRENPVKVVSDVQAQTALPYLEGFRKAGVQTVALAALFRGSDLAGALICAFTDQARLLPEDEIALLRGLADQAASAIENAELFEQVRAGRERQRKLAKSLVDVQECERRHIARELHDHLGQMLTGLQFMLEKTKNQSAGKQRAALEDIQESVSDIIRQVREMSLALRPSMLDDMGLIPTLLWHFDRYTTQTGIHVNFRYDELPKRLPLEIETAGYRIVQEALTNVARYAQVKEVFVGLILQDKTLWVEILDEGRGFDTSLALEGLSSGIGGMRERASLLGGYLVVESFLNQGTQIVAALPITGQPLERRRYDRDRSPR